MYVPAAFVFTVSPPIVTDTTPSTSSSAVAVCSVYVAPNTRVIVSVPSLSVMIGGVVSGVVVACSGVLVAWVVVAVVLTGVVVAVPDDVLLVVVAVSVCDVVVA